MKIINNRQEIAQYLNFNKYPILSIDFSKPIKSGKDKIVGFEGCQIRVPWEYHGEKLYMNGQLLWFGDTKKLYLNNDPCVISSRLTNHDLYEMIEEANAPIIDCNQEFIINIIDSEEKIAITNPLLFKTDNYKNINGTELLMVLEGKIDLLDIYYMNKEKEKK